MVLGNTAADPVDVGQEGLLIEAVNNLVKRIKRVAFGITNLRNYRIRALLYAGKPNWALLATLTPR